MNPNLSSSVHLPSILSITTIVSSFTFKSNFASTLHLRSTLSTTNVSSSTFKSKLASTIHLRSTLSTTIVSSSTFKSNFACNSFTPNCFTYRLHCPITIMLALPLINPNLSSTLQLPPILSITTIVSSSTFKSNFAFNSSLTPYICQSQPLLVLPLSNPTLPSTLHLQTTLSNRNYC